MILRAHKWMHRAGNLTWITGVALLGIVYYGGGALTTPTQSAGAGNGYRIHPAVCRMRSCTTSCGDGSGVSRCWQDLVSLALVASAAVWMNRIMTGRAVFIHIGAMLATIMLVNVEQRIWPVERRRLAVTPVKKPPSVHSIETAADSPAA